MDQEEKPDPAHPAPGQGKALSSKKLAEKQRLAEALRANLRRRKAQSRQRKAFAEEESGSSSS